MGYLLSLHFTIYEKQGCPQDALEQWRLNVIYFTDPDTGLRFPSGVNVTEHRQLREKITVGAAKQSLTNFIQKVTNMSFGMPDLPSSRYMSLAVLYTDDTPDDYEAPNFTEQVLDAVRFPNNEDWEKVSTGVASMDAGYHRVSLSATHLKWRHEDGGGGRLPSGLLCTEKVTEEETKGVPQLSYTQTPKLRDLTVDSDKAQHGASLSKITHRKMNNPNTSELFPPSTTNHPAHPHDRLSESAVRRGLRPQESSQVSKIARSSTADKVTKQKFSEMVSPLGCIPIIS